MDLDYQPILNQIGQIVQLVLPLGITIGLIERLVNWILRCATGKES